MLITDAYREQQQQLHSTTVYGTAAAQWAEMVASIIEQMEVSDLLDYGCGSRLTLLKTLKSPRKFRYQAYDPGVPEYAGEAQPSEMVACIDVLEHIEPSCLWDVLGDLRRVTKTVGFFTIHCGPAAKHLPDGRNAHLIQKPPEWWLERIQSTFTLQTFQRTPEGCYVIVTPLELPHGN